jgi:hypothetical protein
MLVNNNVRALAAAAVCVPVLILSACSSGGTVVSTMTPSMTPANTPTSSVESSQVRVESSEPAVTTADRTAATTASETKRGGYVDIQDQPGTADDFVGARKDATIDTCQVTDGKLAVKGTVTNPADSAQQYRIYVSAIDGDDTVGVAQVDVKDVKSSDSADWETNMPVNTDTVKCVLRVERFAAGA